MSISNLPVDYVDDVLNTTSNERRKYRMIENDDGTVSFEDVTEYLQSGSTFSAVDINNTNATVNELIANDEDKQEQIDDIESTVDNMSSASWCSWIGFQARDISSENYLLASAENSNSSIVSTVEGEGALQFNSAGRYLLILRLSINTENPYVTIDLYRRNSSGIYEQYRTLGISATRGCVTMATVIGESSTGARYQIRVTNGSLNTVSIGDATALLVVPLF